MPALVTRLKLSKVALCQQGMNPHADILLYKAADMVAKDLGEAEIEIKVEIEPGQPEILAADGLPQTTAQRLRTQQLWSQWWPLWDAFTQSMFELSCAYDDGTAEVVAPLMSQSIGEFQGEADRLLTSLGLMNKAQPLLELCRVVVKAGAKMSAQRMTQLKNAIATLQAILVEAGGMMEKGVPPMADELAVVTKRLELAEAEVARLTTALAKALETPEEQEAAFMKALPEAVRKKWEAAELEKAELAAALSLEKGKREQAEYIEKTAAYRLVGLAPDDWQVLKAVDTLPEHVSARVLQLLKAAGEQLRKGALFSEAGLGRAQSGSGTIEDEIQGLMTAEVAKGLSPREAIMAVAKARPELYESYTRDIQQRSRVSS